MSRFLPTRRTVGFVVVATIVAAAAFLYDPRELLDPAEEPEPTALRDTSPAQVSTLTTSFEAEGTLTYAPDATAFLLEPPGEETTTTTGSGRSATTETTITPASMVVTQLVSEGTRAEEGDVLWRLGNEPTVLLYGASASFRDLAEGDTGPDVLQLETALVRLGYDPDETVTVDEDFTARTEDMVERWQDDVGAEVDGVVHHGSVVYVSGPSRVGDIQIAIGETAQDGSAAFDLSTLTPQVTFAVPASDRETIAVGDTVDVRADRRPFQATVTASTVTDDGGASLVAVPTDTVELSSDTVPAEISWNLEIAVDVVTVPAEAILRTDDQRTWVEVRDEAGVESWVEVQVGRVSNGRAEVAGDLAVGTLVVAP